MILANVRQHLTRDDAQLALRLIARSSSSAVEESETALRELGIEPVLAKRGTGHGSGLGVFRWVVERSLSWLHQFRRLRVRYERRADIHEAFVSLACCLICWSFL